jgi:hypothetical protein
MPFHFASSRLNLAFITVLLSLSVLSSAQVTPTKERLSIAELPIQFEPNYGQADAASRFVAHLPTMELILRAREFDLYMARSASRWESLSVQFVNANEEAVLSGADLRTSKTNYLLGANPSRWHTHIPNFGRVTYSGLYPGIDAVFYGTGQRLEHDFIVSPDADYRAIRMRLSGSEGIDLQTDGQLRIKLPSGELFFAQPNVYQTVGKSRHKLSGSFAIVGRDEIAFQIGPYDHSIPLVIDPVLTYSTFLANYSISMSAIATDSAGSAYLTGVTNWPNFPVTLGAFQTTCNTCPNGNTVFVTKFTPDGTALVYSTFLGGTDSDGSSGIAVDSNGNAIVVGSTGASGFPLKNPIAHGYVGFGVTLGFITSLSVDGSALNYSSILGGSAQAGQSSESGVNAIVLDGNGTAYITGGTDSPAFPVTPGAYNQGPPAYPETIAFVMKFPSVGSLAYSSLIGNVFPPPEDSGYGFIGISGIAVDTAGSAYITGSAGTLWPTTPGAYQTQIPGTTPWTAPFVTKLSPDASSLTYSTFLGPSGQASGITVDGNGEAIVSGFSAPSGFPTTGNAYEPSIPAGACCPSYLSKFSADGSQLLYSTFFYGNLSFPPTGWTNITGLTLDSVGNLWIAGNTSDVQLPLQHPIQSVPGPLFFPAYSGFLSQFDPTGTQLMFSTYFGAPVGGMAMNGPAIDGQGKVHIAGTVDYQLYTSPGVYLGSVAPNSDYAYGFAAAIDPSVASPAMCVAYPWNQGLGFGNVLAGSSANLMLKVTNCGAQALSMSSFQSSSPVFTIPTTQNGCSQQVAVNASCTLIVTFTPATFNTNYSGTLTVSGNTSMPLIMLLSGTGIPSLGLTAPGSAGTATVTAGGTATYTVNIGGEGISGTASLKCTGAPLNAVCSVPGAVTVSATNVSTLSIMVSTAAPSRAAADFPNSSWHWSWASAIVGIGMLVFPMSRPRRSLLRGMTTMMAVAGITLLLSCGGGSSGSPGSGGTPPGTYTLTVTATAGSATQSLPLTLTVQ